MGGMYKKFISTVCHLRFPKIKYYKRPAINLGKEAGKEFSKNTQTLGKAKIEFFSAITQLIIHFNCHLVDRVGHDGNLVKGLLLLLFLPSLPN